MICKRVHTDAPRLKNGQCVECRRITNRESRKRNRERHKERDRAAKRRFYLAHREAIIAANTAYYRRRKEAKRLKTLPWVDRDAGAARYYTGYPCRNGHDSERSSKSGKCVACVKVANRKSMGKRNGSPIT